MPKVLVFALFVLLCVSCGQLSDLPGRVLSNESNIKITVDLVADGTINPGYQNQSAQPVKACLFIIKSKYWSPDGVYDGTPCSEKAQSNEVVDSRELMVSPNQRYQIEFDLVYNKRDSTSIWILAGANFQQINDFKPVDRAEVEKKNKRVVVPVRISRNEVSIGRVRIDLEDKDKKGSKKSSKKSKETDNVIIF